MNKNPYPSNTIRPRRLAAGLTQSQLARLVDVQMATVQAWEKGWWKPRPELAAKLNEVLGPPKQEETK